MKGVWFDDIHSYSDLGLILTSKEIPLPEPKTYTIEVPSADGVLDLSTALTGGDIKYKNRIIKMNFSVLPSASAETVRSIVANHLHGRTVQVVFDADDDFYHQGRCKISAFNTSVFPVTMTIEMDAEPYKYNRSETTITKTVTTTETITVPEQKMKVVPTINVSANMTLTYKSTQYSLTSGNNIIPAIQLSSGTNNTLQFSGTGTVIITFRGGEL